MGSRPPSSSPASARATWMAVTRTGPWPIETEIVSLGYQRDPRFVRAHSSEGTSPDFSKREVDAGRPSEPERGRDLAMRSMPSRRPRL